jgi:hypothetical protein
MNAHFQAKTCRQDESRSLHTILNINGDAYIVRLGRKARSSRAEAVRKKEVLRPLLKAVNFSVAGMDLPAAVEIRGCSCTPAKHGVTED